MQMASHTPPNKPVCVQSDIWSLGCILYEMATLNHPFLGRNLRELYGRVRLSSVHASSSSCNLLSSIHTGFNRLDLACVSRHIAMAIKPACLISLLFCSITAACLLYSSGMFPDSGLWSRLNSYPVTESASADVSGFALETHNSSQELAFTPCLLCRYASAPLRR